MRHLYSLCLMFVSMMAVGQIPDAGFQLPEDACIAQNIAVARVSGEDELFEWDFCANDLAHYQSATETVTLPGFLGGFGYRVLEHAGNWYGFALSQAGNWLFRMDFGNSPLNTPQIVDIGNLNNALIQPQGIEFIFDEGQWYGFVGHAGTSGTVVRLDFGSSLSNMPVATPLGDFGQAGSVVWDLEPVIQNGHRILLLADRSVDRIIRVDFGASFASVPGAGDVFVSSSIPNASNVFGIDAVEVDGDMIVLATSYFNNSLLKLNYGSNLLEEYSSVEQITFPDAVKQPVTIHAYQEGDQYYAFVGNNDTYYGFSIVGFGDFTSTPEETQTFLPVLYSVDAFRWEGRTYVTGLGSSSVVQKLTFENQCGASPSYSAQPEHLVVQYETPGVKPVSLRVTNSFGSDATVKTIHVAEDTAPLIDFLISDEVCVEASLSFTPTGDLDAVASYTWDFGDETSLTTETSPSHQYPAPGLFHPSLEVVGHNGCRNTAAGMVKLYQTPNAGFDLPDQVICTNNEYGIANTTMDLFDGHLSFQWFINNQPGGTGRDLSVVFSETGETEVKLVASIPGCSHEVIKIIPSVGEGPVVDFEAAGICEREEISFTPLIHEPVTSYAWDFGDGEASALSHPLHIFTDHGDKVVSLTAISPNGCETTYQKTVVIRETPEPDFYLQGPPSSCASAESIFVNQTPDLAESQVVSWTWTFGDPGDNVSTLRDPAFIFEQAGTYSVALVAVTNEGCGAEVERLLEILPAPAASITWTVACVNSPVAIEGSGDNIAEWYWETGTSVYEGRSFTHSFHTPGNHDVFLSLTGHNGCVTDMRAAVHVPAPLTPDFSYGMNCAGYEMSFVAAAHGSDPVETFAWNFAGVPADDPAETTTWSFHEPGEKSVALTVTTTSGCTYKVQKLVPVVESPVASFGVSAKQGGAPFKVRFTNSSQFADNFVWKFNDPGGTVSDEPAPEFTFAQVGDYEVELTATNDEGCAATTSQIISVLEPVNDVVVRFVTADDQGDGTYKLIVTLQNVGNTLIENLPVKIDVAGYTSLLETIAQPIEPSAFYNLVSAFRIQASASMTFICAETLLEGDVSPADNRSCVELRNEAVYLAPYPNPVGEYLHVEWIASAQVPVKVTLSDSFGRVVSESIVTSTQGLNRIVLDLTRNTPGIYYLTLGDGAPVSRRRIVVSR